MEPGHEDREYPWTEAEIEAAALPQWSPVMKTGNTCFRQYLFCQSVCASMEPGHEDREYSRPPHGGNIIRTASMEPGHEDREYPSEGSPPWRWPASLNGARS